jgi:hypothetical protein
VSRAEVSRAEVRGWPSRAKVKDEPSRDDKIQGEQRQAWVKRYAALRRICFSIRV